MNPRLVNIILLSLSFVVMVIGVHRSLVEEDIVGNYWLYMIGLVLFMLYYYRKRKNSA
ncbi:hypothetical protein GCM10023188_02210 [Pontibacter saemangeumensis]|uniref:LPXTG-motif cell wall anchor domain-containing protein n=1 Tax=Pontibacter saemangeumensis TaxID=1084525 RepID=A0ABP8L708_9BACT